MNNLYFININDLWAYLKSQDSLFWLVNFYLFLEYIRPLTLYPFLNVIPLTRIVIISTLVVLLLEGNLVFVKNTINKLLFLFFLVIVFSSVFALSPEVAFSNIFDIISWMIIFFLIINIVNTEKRFLVFMLAFLLYSFKMSQFSFLQWLAIGFSFHRDGSGGGPGFFRNSGEFGIQMCIFLSLSAYFFFALKDYWPTWKKGFFFLFPFTAMTGTISCSSRGALAGAGAVLFVMLIKSRHKFKGMFILFCVVVLVYSFIPDTQIQRFKASGNDSTSISRLEMWGRGLELLSQFPALGVGYKNWGIAQYRIYGIDKLLLPHNIFIECASELGYLGLLVFLLMILFTFANNNQTRKLATQIEGETRFLIYMAHGLDGALVGFLVSGFFVTVLYYPYFWINLAMTVALNSITRKQVEVVRVDKDRYSGGGLT